MLYIASVEVTGYSEKDIAAVEAPDRQAAKKLIEEAVCRESPEETYIDPNGVVIQVQEFGDLGRELREDSTFVDQIKHMRPGEVRFLEH